MPDTPSYRRPLNSKQLDILRLLYRFRFVTSNLLTITLQLKDPSKTNQRLRILMDQEYIGRKYEPGYRLLGRHASYHLLPKGINALRELSETEGKMSATVLHSLHKDKSASDQFIERRLGVLGAYCHTVAHYNECARFFTQSELARYKYFPKPRPDAYIRLKVGDHEGQFFLEVLNDKLPFFRVIGRLKQYITYFEDGEWEVTNSEQPTVLLVCESPAILKRLLKVMPGIVEDEDAEEMKFYATTRDRIMSNATDRIWLSLTEPSEGLVSLLGT